MNAFWSNAKRFGIAVLGLLVPCAIFGLAIVAMATPK